MKNMSDENAAPEAAGSDDQDFDELLQTVGEGLDPFKALVAALNKCGKTNFTIKGEKKLVIDHGSEVCPHLSVQQTSRSCELFCTNCGITCEIKLTRKGQEGAASAVEELSDEPDELGELLDAGQDEIFDDIESKPDSTDDLPD